MPEETPMERMERIVKPRLPEVAKTQMINQKMELYLRDPKNQRTS